MFLRSAWGPTGPVRSTDCDADVVTDDDTVEAVSVLATAIESIVTGTLTIGCISSPLNEKVCDPFFKKRTRCSSFPWLQERIAHPSLPVLGSQHLQPQPSASHCPNTCSIQLWIVCSIFNIQLKKKDSEWTLEGNWDGKSLYGPCIPGKVFLKREVPKA